MKTIGKKKSATQTTNTYQYLPQPTNPYYEQSKQLIDGYDGGAGDIQRNYGRLINQINESGNEFAGPNTSPEVADKVRKGRLFRATTDKGEALAGAKQNEIAYKNSGYMALGGATAPNLVQTGGTSNSQQWGGQLQNFGFALGSSAGSALGT